MQTPNKITKGSPLISSVIGKLSEIVDYLRASRIVPGTGVKLSETPNGIILSVKPQEVTGRTQFKPGASGVAPVLAEIYSREGMYYSVRLYENGYNADFTGYADVVIPLNIGYGETIPAGTHVMLYPCQIVSVECEVE